MLSSPYTSCILFFPSGQRTQLGFEFAKTHTISSGAGNSVSMAEANGWINSGQWWSHNHSIVLQLEQKLRSEEHNSSFLVPRSLIAVYFLWRTKVSFPIEEWVQTLSILKREQQQWKTNLINSFPFFILSVLLMPPKLTLPLYPPTFRQMLHAHSW